MSVVADILAHRPFGTNLPFSNGGWIQVLGLNLDKMPNLGPLWYVRCLFFFILLSPLFKACVDKLRLGWIVLAFLATSIFSALPDDPANRPFWSSFLRYGLSLSGVFYFSVGIYIRRFNVSVRSTPLALTCAAFGIDYLIARTIAHAHGVEFLDGLLSCLILPALMFAVWHVTPTRAFPDWLTSSSFPIFLLHMIFLRQMGVVVKRCHIGLQMGAVLSCIVAIAASVLLTNLLRRRFPRLSDFLFSGRA